MELVQTTIEYKWIYGLCEEAVPALILGVSIVISVKLVISFVLAIRRKKETNKKADP